MKNYKSTRIKNAIESEYGYKYISCKKNEKGNYDCLFSDNDDNIHNFVATFTDTMIIILAHKVGAISFVETEVVSDETAVING